VEPSPSRILRILWDVVCKYFIIILYFGISNPRNKSYPCNRPWRPIELWDVEAPTFCLDNRLTDAVRSSTSSNTWFFKLAGWYFGYCGHYWPIVPAPDDRWWWLWRNWWNEDWQGKPKYSEKTLIHDLIFLLLLRSTLLHTYTSNTVVAQSFF
jgi:hypothetical protein